MLGFLVTLVWSDDLQVCIAPLDWEGENLLREEGCDRDCRLFQTEFPNLFQQNSDSATSVLRTPQRIPLLNLEA